MHIHPHEFTRQKRLIITASNILPSRKPRKIGNVSPAVRTFLGGLCDDMRTGAAELGMTAGFQDGILRVAKANTACIVLVFFL